MTASWKILVVSSDLESRRHLANILTQQGLDPICASAVSETLNILRTEEVGLVFCDAHLSDGNYRDLLAAQRSFKSRVRLVVNFAASRLGRIFGGDAARSVRCNRGTLQANRR